MLSLKSVFNAFLLSVSLSMLFSCSDEGKAEDEILICAAASLTDVLTEIVSEFERENDREVKVSFASSSVCARQIKEGLPCSVFISANEQWMEYLDGYHQDTPYRVLVQNTLQIVVPQSSPINDFSLSRLKEGRIGNIAMGDPGHVPAGIYGKGILTEMGLWKDIETKVIGAMDVRAALYLVESGAADCGIVYKTDAVQSEKVRTVYEFPAERVSVTYYASLMTNSQGAADFFDYLYGDESRRLFTEYGFVTEARFNNAAFD